MASLTAYINGIGLLAPGLSGWRHSRAILAAEQPYQDLPLILPAPELLPAAERRRCGPLVRLTLATGLEAAAAAGTEPASLPCVYASSGGDGQNCHEICQTLASNERDISPTRFHNSVHNAAPGYWGIATGSTAPVSVLAALDASFGAGLLETLALVASSHGSALLIACDMPYPEPLHQVRPIPEAFGMAMVVAATASRFSLARIRVSLSRDAAHELANPGLEHLRRNIPAARSLPLLQALARPSATQVILDYLDQTRIRVEIEPC